MQKWKVRLFLLFLLLGSTCFSQQQKIDSLQNLLRLAKEDSLKVNALNALSTCYLNSSPSEAIAIANKAKDLANKLDYQKGLAYAYKNAGIGFWNQGFYVDALRQYKSSLIVFQLLKDKKGIANIYSNIGNIYNYQGEDSKAVDLYLQSLKIAEEIKDTLRIASLSVNLGSLYMNKRSTYYKALEYNFKALKLCEIIKDKNTIGAASVNIGDIYFDQGNKKEALVYYQKSLQAYEGTIDYPYALNAIGKTYFKNQEYQNALKYFDQSFQISKSQDSKFEMATALISIGQVNLKLKEYKKAQGIFNEAKEISEEIGAKNLLFEIYKGLASVNSALHNYELAYTYYTKFSLIKDSLYNVESDKKRAFLQGSFDLEKKQNQINLLEKDKELSKKEIKSKQTIQIALLAFLAAVLSLLVFVYRFYIIKKKSNIELELKNNKIELQKSEITKSIEYAQKIQNAMLPEEELIEEVLFNSFLFYQPKDIVSGDFYVCIKEGEKVFVAVADCTGHGVPGALMSMIGSNIINKLISDKGLTNPAEILTQLNAELIVSLKQNKNAGNDGMDIALCAIDFKKRELKFAGAYRPLYLVRGNELIEVKGSKFPIGGHQVHDERLFVTHHLELKIGDKFYLSTDGFADQFGGEQGKKLTTKKFKEQILSIKDKHIKQQGLLFQGFFERWKGANEQLDDICILGFEVIES